MFFVEKDAEGKAVDYSVAVEGGLRLVPGPGKTAELEEDYEAMVRSGLLLGDDVPFEQLLEQLLERCEELAMRAN